MEKGLWERTKSTARRLFFVTNLLWLVACSTPTPSPSPLEEILLEAESAMQRRVSENFLSGEENGWGNCEGQVVDYTVQPNDDGTYTVRFISIAGFFPASGIYDPNTKEIKLFLHYTDDDGVLQQTPVDGKSDLVACFNDGTEEYRVYPIGKPESGNITNP